MSYEATASLTDLFDPDPLERCAKRIVDAVGDALLSRVKLHTPVNKNPFWDETIKGGMRRREKRRPGSLRESWEKGEVLVVQGSRVVVSVKTDDPIAPYVEWDTKPHRIKPTDEAEARARARSGGKRGASLRFRDRETGEVIYAKEVQHPGTTGAHMMAKAMAEISREWPVLVRRELRQWKREQLAGVR